MRIVGSIIGVVLVLLGGMWALQGSNIMANTLMSGQNQWLVIGIIVLVIGFVILWWFNLRGRPMP